MTPQNFGTTLPIEMATFSLETSVNTLPDTPILPNFVDHPVVLAKLIDFSIFKDLDSREVVNTLKTYFNSMDMLVIACSESPQPVPLQQMTLEALEFAMTFTVKSEPQALLGDDNINSFNDFKAAIEANDEESASAMEEILNLSYNCILEAIATRSVKKGALYQCPFAQRPVLLLGNRSLYFTDKGRVRAAEARAKKAARKCAAEKRSGQPKDDSAFQPGTKASNQKQSAPTDNEGYASNQSIEDVSCHGGDGDSPYPSEWEGNSQHSAPATPEFRKEEPPGLISQLIPVTPMPQLSLTSNPLPQTLLGPSANTGTPNIRLAPSTFLPMGSPGSRSISLGQYASPYALGGSLGSVPDFGKPSGSSSKRKAKKSKNKKSKKSKPSRSRSPSSSSSVRSIEVPPPKPSVDQVLSLYLIYVFYIPLSLEYSLGDVFFCKLKNLKQD